MGTARLSAVCLLLPWAVACGPGPITLADGGDDVTDGTDGTDGGTAGTSGTPTGTTGTTGDTGDTTGGTCSTPAAADLGSGVPAYFEAPTFEFGNDDSSECGGEAAPDFHVLWTAPEAGTYVFETTGSDFDTVLHLRDGACGALLDCNDDVFEDWTSRVVRSLDAGQTVAVVVDGYFDSAGFAFLSIRRGQEPGECPDEEIPPGLPITVYADSSVDANDLWSDCGGFDGPEHTWRFSAPYSGSFRFDTLGSPFDTVLYLRDGSCEGFELACNDDAPEGLHSQLDVFLEEGQEVVVVVDDLGGGGGPIQLNITGDDTGGVCPELDLGGPGGVGFDSFGASDDYTGACGGPGPDVTHRFVAPYSAIWFFQIGYSDFQPALDVLSGCGGPSLGCDGIGWGFGGPGVARYLDAGEEVIAVVDSRNGQPGYYELLVDEISCPQQQLFDEVPLQVLGSTAVSVNALGASCGGAEAPERTYQFVAPFSASYRIRTQGSQYDTLLHVRNGGCGGDEIACNDDTPQGLWSEVNVSLSAGQEITIAVDGYGGEAGPFSLAIEPQ